MISSHAWDAVRRSFNNTRWQYEKWMAEDPTRQLWMYQSCMSEGCDSGINLSQGCDKIPKDHHWPCDSGWPSLMIDAPAIMNRIFPVLGYHYKASGELCTTTLPLLICQQPVLFVLLRLTRACGWLVADWQTNFADTCTRENVVGNCPVSELGAGRYGMNAWTDQLIMGGNGDGNLLYPGTKDKVGGETFIPIASVRLKQLRDGMEDNAYLHLLEAAEGGGEGGRANAMALLKTVVSNSFTYTRDIELWARTREEIGRRIEAAA